MQPRFPRSRAKTGAKTHCHLLEDDDLDTEEERGINALPQLTNEIQTNVSSYLPCLRPVATDAHAFACWDGVFDQC